MMRRRHMNELFPKRYHLCHLRSLNLTCGELGGMVSVIKPRFYLFALLLFLSYKAGFSISSDTLSPGQSLSVNQTIISPGGIFELGFFTTGTHNIYLGIWYKSMAVQTIVWTANRDEALSDPSSSRLEFSQDGNLILLHNSTTPVWSTNLSFPTSNSTEAVLLDEGNFVLRDVSNSSTLFWQSFNHPTDTLLPGAKFGINKVTGEVKNLISWKNSEDPAPGMFSVEMDPKGSTRFFVVWNRSLDYWTSGVWDGQAFSLVPELSNNLYDVFNYNVDSNDNESYLTYSLNNTSLLSRFVISWSGQIRLLTLVKPSAQWNLLFSGPGDLSQVYSLCGAFGIFHDNVSTYSCDCLPGYEPFSIKDIKLNDWSGGCVRKTPLQCENTASANGKKDRFLKMPNMKLSHSKYLPAANARMCEFSCMENCSCTAYAFNGTGCSIWEGALFNLHLLVGNSTQYGKDLYLRLASELRNTRGHRKLWVSITVPVSLTVLICSFFICCLCTRMHKRKEKDSGMDLLSFDFNVITATADEPNAVSNQREGGKKDAELPSFSFASVSAATGNFSPANKLGEGGFGPVYKGMLLKGQEIAVKRLSKRSRQGLEEFRNETQLIAKLQHKNLVRLLGRCTKRDEYILIYEYMPNKSLDLFLFDPNKQVMLDWVTRIRIIEGIAQGLLYLHEYSRLRIIHRDLKAGNILLDSEMNPKISDFGMARILSGNDSRANTNRIVGTYGYMSPEYAMEGRFSIKSDVFSFGVLLLEIVSGKKNTGFHQHDSLNLLGYAWELWNVDRGLEMIDPILVIPSSTSLLLRYINIGLLCVQESPTDRPAMSNIVSMLNNEHTPLPTPKKPAFYTGCCVVDSNSARRSAGICSENTITISTMNPR